MRPQENPLQSVRTIELSFIHEFGANCYEFLRDDAFDIPKEKIQPSAKPIIAPINISHRASKSTPHHVME
jgi:hypothetical protein